MKYEQAPLLEKEGLGEIQQTMRISLYPLYATGGNFNVNQRIGTNT